MSLPFNADGELAPGAYPVTIDTLYETFVEDAPHREVRRLLYAALRLHLDSLRLVGGSAPVIIGGGFISHKAAPPSDVDLVYLCRDTQHLADVLTHDDALSLLTLQNGYITSPAMFGFKRIQPVVGKVDAFLATPGRYDYWRALWSTVKGTGHNGIPREKRGYVEVTL